MSDLSESGAIENAPILVGRSIATNSLLSLGSMVTGFAVQVLTARYFGASAEMDAFLIAFLLLFFLQGQLQSGGILASAFIPSFNRALREGTKEARALFTTASMLTILVSLCLSLGCLILATPIIHFLGEGLSTESALLAVRIFRIFASLFVPLALAGLFAATLQAQGRFLAAASGPVVINCCIATALVLFARGGGIMSYVWGLSAGLVCQAVIVLRPVATEPAVAPRLVSWKDPNVRAFAGATGVLLIDMLSGFLLLAVERNMASTLASGTVSHLNYARSLSTLPLRLIVAPAQVVAFSLLAQQFAAGRTGEVRRASSGALRLVVFLMLPAAVLTMWFSSDIVRLVYERGQFTREDTRATARLLGFYALSIPALALWWQLRMISFAVRNVAVPLIAGVLALAVFCIGNGIFLGRLGAASLALNWAVAYYAASVVLAAALAYGYGVPDWSDLVKRLLRLGPAVVAAFGCLAAFQRLLLAPERLDDAPWMVAGRIAVCGSAGLVTYVGVASAAGVEEVRTLSAVFSGAFRCIWRLGRALVRRSP